MSMRLSVLCSVALVTASLAGAASAGVRVIHASPTTPAVDVYVNNVPGAGVLPNISGLNFRNAAPSPQPGYIPLPTGTYDFRVTPSGSTTVALSALGVNLDGNTDYTVAAIGFLPGTQPSGNTNLLSPLLLVDDRTSNPNAARVRFVHAAPDVPRVDIGLLSASNTNAGDLFSNVDFGTAAANGYVSVPGGTYDLGVFLDVNGALALPVRGLTLQNGFVYTVFAMGSLSTNDVQAVVFVDAIPSPGAFALLGLGGLAALRRRR